MCQGFDKNHRIKEKQPSVVNVKRSQRPSTHELVERVNNESSVGWAQNTPTASPEN